MKLRGKPMDNAIWQPHAAAFLEAAGCDPAHVLQAARLALMLAPEGETAVVAVEIGGNRVAWCRTYSTGWACVAIAPDDGRRSAARADFFAQRWPRDWQTPGAIKREMRRKADAPFVVGGMAWANDPCGQVRVARVASVEPLALELRPGDVPELAEDTALAWRPFQHNADGLAMEWQDGRILFHNFRLAAMRAGLRIKRRAAPPRKPRKPRKAPETAEARAARIARWAEACKAGRERKRAERAARQNVEKGG